jgi:hypothetical protein
MINVSLQRDKTRNAGLVPSTKHGIYDNIFIYIMHYGGRGNMIKFFKMGCDIPQQPALAHLLKRRHGTGGPFNR